MPFYRWDELKSEFMTPEYSPGKGPTVQGDRILMARLFYPAGGKAQPHAHPNEQIIWVVNGRQRIRIGNEEKIMGPGEIVLIPANTEHESEILEDLEIITCKDIVPDWSIKHARWEKKTHPGANPG